MATTIEVKSKKTDRSVSFEKEFGASIEEALSMFGAEVVFSTFLAQCTIRAQNAARVVLDKAAFSKDQAIAAGVAYTPGVIRKASPEKKKEAAYETIAAELRAGRMTLEQLAEIMAAKTSS